MLLRSQVVQLCNSLAQSISVAKTVEHGSMAWFPGNAWIDKTVKKKSNPIQYW